MIAALLGSWLLTASSDERALTTWLAEAAGRAPAAEVVTAADVQQLLAMQGEQQKAGCNDSSEACAAELASALGAELVVRAELSTVDGARTLAVSVVNTQRLGATRRALWQASSTAGLAEQARAKLPTLLREAHGADGPMRVFVVDVVGLSPGESPSTPVADVDHGSASWMLPAGGVVAGVGALGLGVAVVAEVVVAGQNASLKKTGAGALTQVDAVELERNRAPWATAGEVAWIAGGAAVVVGGALLSFGVLE